MSFQVQGVPFTFFCSLLREISQIKPRTTASRRKDIRDGTREDYPALDTFGRWVKKLRERYSSLPPGTTAICFRLLFPDEDIGRKFEIKECRLARYLSDILALPHGILDNWNSYDASGCLGSEVMQFLKPKFSDGDEAQSPFTMAEVDELLDELASTSEYSDASIRKKYPPPRRSRTDILRTLFRHLPPQEAAFMTHIILKDLRPILYPLPELDYSMSLLDFNSHAVKMLTIKHAMTIWDPSRYMVKLYRVKASLIETATASEMPDHAKPPLKPIIGSMIQLPKSTKGTGCQNALSHFTRSTTVWAETKYDGERAQIHVEVLQDGSPKIKIFSKSKRDSTWDRLSVHGIIRETLGFNTHLHSRVNGIKKNIVLDAELVAWHEDQIDEFWRIDALIKQTGSGARSRRGSKTAHKYTETENEVYNSQLSEMSDKSQVTGRHLGLVFFDVLVLDNEPLIFQAYTTRRQLLEILVTPIPTKAIFSDRYRIDMSGPDPSVTLQTIFTEHMANHQEGLILKAEESEYNDDHLPWVKLKKDYIQGFGDCIDLVIVAAGWDRDRARELRVTPNVYTTFWVGAITNTRDVQAKPSTKPHILIFFTVSYGLDRKKLEDFNFRIRHGDNIPFTSGPEDHNNLPFTFTLSTHLAKPQTIIQSPYLAELLCAGFSKGQNNRHYEPRFPRIEKIHGREERPWPECMDITDLDRIARECVGGDRPGKDIDDWCNSLWGKPISPSERSRWPDREVVRNLEGSSRDEKEPYKRRRVNFDPVVVRSEEQRRVRHSETSCHSHEAQSLPLYPICNTHTPKQPSTGSFSVQSNSFVSCFMKSSSIENCHDCLRWKSVLAKGRRIHSLESLLIACATECGVSNTQRGVIFVHSGDKATVASVVKKMEGNRSGIRAQIALFECNSEKLDYNDALFVLQ